MPLTAKRSISFHLIARVVVALCIFPEATTQTQTCDDHAKGVFPLIALVRPVTESLCIETNSE